MTAPRNILEDFLKQTGLDCSRIDTEAVLQRFLDEMNQGLRSTNGSLAMIPTFMDPARPIPANRNVIVLDAGGTHLRVGCLTFNADLSPSLAQLSQHRMPGSQGPLSKDQFFNQFVSLILPLADTSDRIGFCFSYPTEVTPDHDARLMYWSKEIDAPDVEGELIGSHLAQRLSEQGHPKRIVILNDTVATLLAAKSRAEDGRYASFIGFILGTGTNMAYIETNANITKRDDLDPAACQVINIEAGNFDGCPRGDVDEAFDQTTRDPGRYMLEKTVAGAYMGPLALQFLKKAADTGLFSEAAAQALRSHVALSTIDLSTYLAGTRVDHPLSDDLFAPEEQKVIHCLLSAVVERAALLTATNLAAVCIQTGTGHDAAHPICINADGSTFRKVPGLASQVEANLKRILAPRSIFFDLVYIDNAPIVGAGVAGLIA